MFLRRRFVASALLLVLAPVVRPCAAQDGADILTGLISKLSFVNAMSGVGKPIGPGDAGRKLVDVFGFEATFNLGTASCREVGQASALRDNCKRKREIQKQRDSLEIRCAQLTRLDEARGLRINVPEVARTDADSACNKQGPPGKLTETVVRKKSGDTLVVESHYAAESSQDVLTEPKVEFELAVGFEKLSGFSTDNDTAVRLAGNVTQYPYVALYANFRPERRVSPYIGLRAGFGALDSFRAITADTAYAASGGDLVFGGSLGLAIEVGEVSFLFEAGATNRNFKNVDWGAKAPASLPTRLGMSTFTVGFGAQFKIPK